MPVNKRDLRRFLNRISECSEGEIVVANILRSIEAGVVDRPLANLMCEAWVGKFIADEAARHSKGAAIASADDVLKLTESEYITTLPATPHAGTSLWASIRKPAHNPFRPPFKQSVSHVKDLKSVLTYLSEKPDLYDPHSPTVPIPIRRRMGIKRMDSQHRSIQAGLDRAKIKAGARVHARVWYWVAPREDVEAIKRSSINAEMANDVIDKLGLVHFSRPPEPLPTNISSRYMVEICLADSFASNSAKPNFIFADHNPRFVAHTDSQARKDTRWGNAADLAQFSDRAVLAKGLREQVRETPVSIDLPSIEKMELLGHLSVNRWGVKLDEARGSQVFADRLRHGRTNEDIIESILAIL